MDGIWIAYLAEDGSGVTMEPIEALNETSFKDLVAHGMCTDEDRRYALGPILGAEDGNVIQFTEVGMH